MKKYKFDKKKLIKDFFDLKKEINQKQAFSRNKGEKSIFSPLVLTE